MNQKKIIENQKKLIRRVSELRQNTLKKRDKRDTIIDESLKSIENNQKELNNAKKNNQITDEHYAGATFLNGVSKAINEDIGASDSETLEKINANLVAIRKQISDYTKAAIDKQDTKISYTDPKRVSDIKAEKSKSSGKGKDKRGILGWLAGLLGLAFLPFLSIFKTIFKIGSSIIKGGAKIIKGLILGVGWIAKNIAFLARLSKGMILGVVELFTHPARFLNNYLLNPIKNLVRGIVGNILSKIPLLRDTKFVKDFVKGTQAAKAANKAAKEAAKAEKMKKVGDAVKSGARRIKDLAVGGVKKAGDTLSGLAQKLYNAISKIPGVGWFVDRIKPYLEKIAKFAGEAVKLLKTALGKMWTIVKSPVASKIITKGVARVTTALVSLGIPGPGWILSAILITWMVVDMIKYLWDYRDTLTESSSGGAKVLIGALIYGFIGWDILGKDNEEWEKLEISSEEDAKKASNIYNEKDIKSASGERAESMRKEYSDQIKKHEDNIKKLTDKTIIYKDAAGNVLSLDDSQKIQALKLEREKIQKDLAKEHQSKIGRKDDPRWLDGEIEITPANYNKMVDYWFDKLKGDSYFYGMFLSKGKEWQLEQIEELKKEYEKTKNLKNYNDIYKLPIMARLQAQMETHQKMYELQDSGMSENEARDEIRKIDRYKSLNEKHNELTRKIAEIDNQLSKYGKVSEQSVQSKDYQKNFTLPNAGNTLEYQQLAQAGAASTPRAAAAAAYAWNHSNSLNNYKGRCAKYVNDAIVAAGYKGYGRGHGYMVGQSLAGIGWKPLSSASNLKVGDVAVFDRDQSTNPEFGHVAILSKNGWVSDAKQSEMSPYTKNKDKDGGQRLRNSYKHVSIWRDTGKQGGLGGSVSGPDSFSTPSFQTSNKTLNTAGLFNTPKQAPTIISQTTPQVPKEIHSTIDLTEYWELQV